MEASMTLSNIVNTENKIFILGNPGLGKSTELKKLAIDSWKEGEFSGFVPIFKNLKNFTNTDDFYNFLPLNWTELNNILLILDGIDEISDIEYFKSKIETFINKEVSTKQIKYVISCRTNIYQSIVLNMPEFKVFYLKNLSVEENIKLLELKCSRQIKQEEVATKFLDYLKTPFHIHIFASYINEFNSLPSNIAELWSKYIENRLNTDKKEKLKKVAINVPLIKKYSRITSLINELMKCNSFTEDNLFKIVNENPSEHYEFLKSSLLDKDIFKDSWYFEHRNIQEYFAALVVSELSFDQIIDFINITNTDSTHPSLFNTITFLINLLDKDSTKFKELIIWLKTNQIEILFRADSDRTEGFKVEVFQHYFKTQCIDKKLWISTNKAFSVKEIGEFGDCGENFKYLFQIISNQNSFHFRVVISALNLLAFFKPNHRMELQLKPLFLNLLASSEIGADIKSEIIQCIETLKFYETDEKYLVTIFGIFAIETNKKINAALLFLISDIQDVDNFFWYMKAEFFREVGVEKRNETDNVYRGNDWKLQELILKLDDSNHFIEIISFYFYEEHSIDLPNDFAIRLLERFRSFSELDRDFILKFFSEINGKTQYYQHQTLLLQIITQSDKQTELATYLIDNNGFWNVRNLISHIANLEILELVLNRFNLTNISSEELIFFRNNLWNSNQELSYIFQNLMSENKFVFDSFLPSENEIKESQKNNLEKIQNNFDSLFDKSLLMQIIKNVYLENGIEDLTTKGYHEISAKWRVENNYPAYFDSSLTILQSFFVRFQSLTFDQVSELLLNDVILFKLMLDSIKGTTKDNLKFVVSVKQEKIIREWCIASTEDIDFNNIVQIHKNDSISLKSDYLKLETILSFQKIFDFSLSKEFLLNCLEYLEIKNFSETENPLEFLFDKINDKKAFEKKIIDNITNKLLFKSVLGKHIDYALKNSIKEAFPKIRGYFLKEKSVHNLNNKLELYFSLTDDVNLLKECCSDVNDFKCWSAIKILTQSEEGQFCIDKALLYLNQDDEVGKDYFVSNAMQVLFHFKSTKALEYYLSFPNFDFHGINFSDYAIIDDYSILETLFFKIYKEDYDKPDFSYGSTFFTTYVSNLSKKDVNSYAKTQEVLIGIKEKLDARSSNNLLFNINFLIDNSKNSYINSQSVPLSFKEALNKVESILD
jgi:hypothetical protein